jgi:hypothetical protein
MTSPYSPKSNPSDLFRDSKLNSIPEFEFLQSELRRFYEKNFSQRLGDQSHSFKWKQSLAWNLQLLLTEIVHTEETEKRQELLLKTLKWYNDYLKIKETSPNPSKVPEDEEVQVLIPEEIPRSRSQNRTYFKPYVPKYRQRKTRQEIASSALKSFENMRKNETLKLNSKDFQFKTQENEGKNMKKSGILNQSLIDSSIIRDETDERFKLPQLFDFRSVSHKSKYMQQRLVPSPILSSNQMKFNEIKEVGSIKKNLARKKQTVFADTLEKALVNVSVFAETKL